MRVIRKIALTGVLVLLAAGAFFAYQTYIAPSNLSYVTSLDGAVKHEVAVTATYANLETLLHAPADGQIQWAGPDGFRLRRFETALSIVPDGISPESTPPSADLTLMAPEGGLLYRSLDNLELVITPDNLMNMDLGSLLRFDAVLLTPNRVQRGEPAGKIVDNLSSTWAFVALPSVENIQVDQTLRLVVDAQMQTGKVKRKSANPTGVVIQFAQFIASSVQQRTTEILWSERPQSNGTIVPLSAIVTHGEEQGVYAVSNNIIHFRPVKIIDVNEKQACVSNLPVGVSVVVAPKPGLEGEFARNYKKE
ncbi:MAG: hypothetical protein LBT32_06745 [Peptococcaceae bacterium]|nr:hypothetical protein [Peptococcaceae bacterium]